MAKYKIAWMPGDGVGNDVMEAKNAHGRRPRAEEQRLRRTRAAGLGAHHLGGVGGHHRLISVGTQDGRAGD